MLKIVFVHRHAAASYAEIPVLEYLLSLPDVNIELQDSDGDTPLLVAEEPAVYDYLVSRGANPHAQNNDGQGIVEKAVEDRNNNLVRHLMNIGIITDPQFSYNFDEDANEENGKDEVDLSDLVRMDEEGDEEGEGTRGGKDQ